MRARLHATEPKRLHNPGHTNSFTNPPTHLKNKTLTQSPTSTKQKIGQDVLALA